MADALISLLVEKLASVVYDYTKEKVTLVLNAEKDVESFSSKLKDIQAVLEDAEKKQVTEIHVRGWLEKLKDVSYEMDDVLDEWNTEILKQQSGMFQTANPRDENASVDKKVCFPISSDCFCFGQVNKAIRDHNIAIRIKELNEKLTLITTERDSYNFHRSTKRGLDEQLIQGRKTTSLVDISTIFGREEEKENLLSKLLRESSQEGEKFLVIPIVGMGGMGKTTLAQLAYNHENVTAHFDKKVWVCVSEPFSEIKIARAILESLDETQRSSNELQTLLQNIKRLVKDQKFLLILDDVWTEDKTKWENLKLPLIMKSCAEGSRILVTTRKQEVAKMMRATSNLIQLDKLNDSDCLELFNSIAFLDRKEDKSNEFEKIGEKIVEKCKGLPLIVKTLSSLVWYKKTIEEWLEVLNSQIWELQEVEKEVFQPLLLSYYDLAPAVKRCLLYCAIFPKDHEFDKNNLIELWMSQDYLNWNQNQEKRRIGQNYFESLVMRSFFQDFRRDILGDIRWCKMHDVVHDFVQFLTQRECIIAEMVQGANKKMKLLGDKVRHLNLVMVREDPFQFSTSFYNCKNIRTLTTLDSRLATPGSIMQLKCLRTLNLSGNILKALPEELGELIHLRYMDLSRSQVLKELPNGLCDLFNLQTLVLVLCSKLEKLPKAMRKLINLKHLYVRGCDNLKYLPKGIESLESLQALDCFYVCDDDDDDDALKLRDLGIMDQLQGTLSILNLGRNAREVEEAQLGNKQHLSQLVLTFGLGIEEQQRKRDEEILKALQPHQNLVSLTIGACHCTTWPLYHSEYFYQLRQVVLHSWKYCEVLPPLGKLPLLEILDIKSMNNVKKVGVEFLGIEELSRGTLFPKLKRLHMGHMENWEKWEGMIEDSSEITIMPSLSSLRIYWCRALKALPDFLHKITALHTLLIQECPTLERDYMKDVGKEWTKISRIPNIKVGW